MLEILICGVALCIGYYFIQGYPKAGKKPINRYGRARAGSVQSARPQREGFSRYESTPQVIVDGVEIKTPDGTAITLPLKLTSTLVIERDEVFADLNRRATDAKTHGDFSTAIALLRQAKERQGYAYGDTKLALYLQQGNRFEESIVEFTWLLERAKRQCWTDFAHQPEVVRRAALARRRAQIHDKARLACKREKELTRMKEHELLYLAYRREAEGLEHACNLAQKADSDAWEKAKAGGREAMAAFHLLKKKRTAEALAQANAS